MSQVKSQASPAPSIPNLRTIDHMPYQGRVKILTSQSSHLGWTGTFVFLHCVNEPTPHWENR